MKSTPQLLVGGGVAALALLLGVWDILGGIGSYPVDEGAGIGLLLKDTDRAAAIDGAEVTAPLIDEAIGKRQRNPFNLKESFGSVTLRIEMPPAPRLASPPPPALPVTGGAP